jgi:hypothetical protein
LELAACYVKNSRGDSQLYKSFYASLKDQDEAIGIIANAEYEERRHSHQRRLTQEALKQVSARLKGLKKAGKLRKRSMGTFGKLFETIHDSIGKIHGVGPLMVYDTAHRLGLTMGLEPENVHLHAGAAEGARKLGIAFKGGIAEDGPVLDALLKELDPSEVEDFLCRYKSWF